MSWKSLDYPLTRKTSGKVRNLDADKDGSLQAWLFDIGTSVKDITAHLLNGSATGNTEDTFDIVGITPAGQSKTGRVRTWYMFRAKPTDFFEANTLLPTGLYFQADVTGRDPKLWKVHGWFYNNAFYQAAEDLRLAWFAAGFEKLGLNKEGDWARTDKTGPTLPLADLPPPEAPTSDNEQRFLLDLPEGYV